MLAELSAEVRAAIASLKLREVEDDAKTAA